MSNLNAVRAAARKLGGTVERTVIGMDKTVEVFSPPGFYWSEGGTHIIVDSVYTGPNDYADILSRMRHGLCKCEDTECEWCCTEPKGA